MPNSVPHKPSPRTFRPWPDNQTQFAFAESQKLNVSELINEVVSKHLKAHIAQKLEANQRAFQRQFGAAPARNSTPKTTRHKTRH